MDKHRILCVDDDPIMQRIYDIVLSEHYTIDTAVTGQEAVDHCQTTSYDAILMDIRLPELTGFEATKQIHLTSKNSSTPIIGVTACGWQHLVKDTSQTNFYHLLNKPVMFDEMLAVVQKAVNENKH
ncbi:MAG: barA [Gammaproteobacteria bacterium]|jgi:CheY-like chemotaxis protein|nr:barA [Gammaproteobacteria bacterium]